jgi:HSP20 family protein
MREIDEVVENLERFYQVVTGSTVPPSDAPYAPIPPERDAEQHVGQQLDRLIDVLGGRDLGAGALVSTWTPDISVWESGEDVLVRVDLPGVPAGAVHVSITQSLLTVEGTRPFPPSNGGGAYRLRHTETTLGRFRRDIAIAPSLVRDQLDAQMKDGVLEIRLPRCSTAAAATRTVDVQ